MSFGCSLFLSFVQFFKIKLLSCLELTDNFNKRGFAPLEPILMALITVVETPRYFWINFEHTSLSSAFLTWSSSFVDSASWWMISFNWCFSFSLSSDKILATVDVISALVCWVVLEMLIFDWFGFVGIVAPVSRVALPFTSGIILGFEQFFFRPDVRELITTFNSAISLACWLILQWGSHLQTTLGNTFYLTLNTFYVSKNYIYPLKILHHRHQPCSSLYSTITLEHTKQLAVGWSRMK